MKKLTESRREEQKRMGCDGGTIPRRDEMVKLKKKAQKVNVEQERSLSLCHIVCPQFVPRPIRTWNFRHDGSTVHSVERS